MEKASDFVAKWVILWYIYPSFVGENFGGDFPFVARLFLYFVYLLQVSNIDNWSGDNPLFHLGSQRVDSLGWFNGLKEVIVRFNGGSCQGCQ